MDYLQAIILSAVEGFAEFLPISSTGHLILATKLLNISQTEFTKSFEIIIQLGAILAVVVLYWKTFLVEKDVVKKVLSAFIPTAIVGLVLYKAIKHYLLGNTNVTLLSLLIGGILLILLEYIHKEKDHHAENISQISTKKTFLVGLFQSIAVIPGVSRSAATIIPALFLGVKRKTAVEFSFLLAVPTMIAATGLDLFKTRFSFSTNEYILMLIGLLGSFFFALLSIQFLLNYIKHRSFTMFGVYRIIVAIVFFLFVK